MSEMPYIPDKRMYAAVMSASSALKKGGDFDRIVSYYAKKYSVDPKELARYVRMSGTKKYYWFAVKYSHDWKDGASDYLCGVVKAVSEENARKRIKSNDSCTGGSYDTVIEKIAKFDSEEKACKCVKRWENN